MLPTLPVVIVLVLAQLYWLPVRGWYRRWGAGDGDLTRAVSKGAEVRNPSDSTVLAVTIDAWPEEVWPWLVQLPLPRFNE